MLAMIRHPASATADAPTLVIAHGLYGSARNWGVIARRLADRREVVAVDMRNHGDSPRFPVQGYPEMAADLAEVIESLGAPVDLLGHSMGGKAAMQLALTRPELVRRLVVADIAPVAYPHARHQNVFAGLNATLERLPQSRSEAEAILAEHIEIPGVRQFLLKSFTKTQAGWGWRFNVPALEHNYASIMGWPDDQTRFEGQTLFIKGGDSDYMQPQYTETVMAQFPAAKARIIAGTGHWLHAEKPALFNKLVVDFLSTGG